MVHKIHIPVMGICYTADTPIRVAHFGITSVISLVDDGLLEEYRMAYAERLGLDLGSPQTTRIGRIRSYLDFVADEVERKFQRLCAERFDGGSDKDLYFLMLPLDSRLRVEYDGIFAKTGLARLAAEAALTEKMEPGEIQANIMVGLNHEEAAFDAVRGFAASKVKGSLVLSAGVNLAVFEEIAKCKDFYRTRDKAPSKKIILKVSDYRSALIQGRYLAKKGLEIYEYRVESGVNCGGHAFFESKKLLLDVVREFVERRKELFETTRGMIEKTGNIPPNAPARITAQGGLCSPEDIEKIMSFGIDGVGVGTPFLLVPQATSMDKETRRLLAEAKPEDVYISHSSPLEIPFVNLRTSTAAKLCQEKIRKYFAPENEKSNTPELKPGFPCRQHYLCRQVPGFDHPVCMASREYVMHRLAEIDELERDELCSLRHSGEVADLDRIQSVETANANENALDEAMTQPFGSVKPSSHPPIGRIHTVFYQCMDSPSENDELRHSPSGLSSTSFRMTQEGCHSGEVTDLDRIQSAETANANENALDEAMTQPFGSVKPSSHPPIGRIHTVFYQCMDSPSENDELRHAPSGLSSTSLRMTQEGCHSGGFEEPDRIQEIHQKYNALRRETLSRECICRFLGNAGREEIREKSPSLYYQPENVAVARGSQPARTREPVTICPNPDIGYFDREYTLFEMMRHLYGTGPRLTPKNKPSAFEIERRLLSQNE